MALFKRQLPDLVTLDIMMPKMDGLACLEQVLKIKPDTKIFIISVLKDLVTGLSALKKGAKGFLPKPFIAIHSVGGWISLALRILIGPRTGRFSEDGTAAAINGSSIPPCGAGRLPALVRLDRLQRRKYACN
jgi:CheY-like chemotaxis protein